MLRSRFLGFVFLLVVAAVTLPFFLKGEKVLGYYGDMVLNSKAEKRGMPPVVFPHWYHRAEFKCKVCHPAVFEMKSGANDIDMKKIIDGQFCGKCHNGTIAWKPVACNRCHSGTPGMTTGVLEGFPK
jgi:c(7)-type cytochrome triheme protein